MAAILDFDSKDGCQTNCLFIEIIYTERFTKQYLIIILVEPRDHLSSTELFKYLYKMKIASKSYSENAPDLTLNTSDRNNTTKFSLYY